MNLKNIQEPFTLSPTDKIVVYNSRKKVPEKVSKETFRVFLELNDYRTIGVIAVSKPSDFGIPQNGVYYLENNYSYQILTDLDLEGARLVGGVNTALLGLTSENSFITSTGLDPNQWLITTVHTMPIQNITIRDVNRGIYLDAPAGAFDWTFMNFLNVPNAVYVKNADNLVYTKGALLNSKGIVLDGNVATFASENSFFQGGGDPGAIFTVTENAVISRRFRITYSSIVAFGATEGIDFSALASVPTENFILDTVNFSGSNEAQYLPGINHTSNSTLFVNCVGVTNTSVNGQMYMRGNAAATTITNTTDFVKIAGITLPSSDNEKYDHSNNRLTNRATISRKYLVLVTLSFNSGNNNVCEFGIYDSKLGGIRQPSIAPATANAAGRAENVAMHCIVTHSDGDYIEIWGRNSSAVTAITVTELNATVTEFK